VQLEHVDALSEKMSESRIQTGIKDEVTGLLRDLIRIDTTNPPGNEIEAAEYLAKTLEKEKFDCEVLESKPRRGSLVTRLEGSGGKPSVLLLSHLDVVAANPKEWSVDPFKGVVKDGFVWGRGALDMKSMTAIEVMALKLLKRRGKKLKGDVLLAATADEEKGGEQGTGWLTRNYPEKIKADYVLNEGGGLAVPVNAKNIFTIQTAEKGMLWLKISAKGTPGHGSIPGAADNAIMRMNRIVSILGNHNAPVVLIPTVAEYLAEITNYDKTDLRVLRSILEKPSMADRILDEFARKNKFFAEELRVKLKMTLATTMIKGGVKENIIPSECEAVFDCRILPGQTTSEAMQLIRKLLTEVDLEKSKFETINASEPSESPLHTQLYDKIIEVLKDFDPACSVTPDMITGGTDSRFLRKLGSVCYGFQPMLSDLPYGEMMKGIHGIDEKISINNLVFGTSVLYDLIRRFMA
jgi:acetylornithine deacetylase/succinyl-diaminopimelate desuccinylase-like protein